MNHEYASEVTRQAVGRACIALGLKSCSKATLDSLSDIVVNYIETIAESALEKAEQGGRTLVGIQDILPVVEHMVFFHFNSGPCYMIDCCVSTYIEAPISFWLERPERFCL